MQITLRSIQACEVSKENEQGEGDMADDRKSNQGGKKQGSSQQGGGAISVSAQNANTGAVGTPIQTVRSDDDRD